MIVVLMLLAIGIVLALAARQFRVPYPVALVVAGLALCFVPGLPRIEVDPVSTLTLVLPPILYQAAIFTSWREFRSNLRPISVLAVTLVFFTTVAVALMAKALVPTMPWAAAFLVGAIVSPSDAVAATAVMRTLNIPRRIVAVIEGESLVNDAAGLVIYKFALVAVMTGAFSPWQAVGQFVLVATGGIALGIAAGWLSVGLQRHMADPMSEIAFSLVLPFTVFLIAEEVEVSAVLAVVAAGLVRGWYSPEAFSPQTRVQASTVWEVIVFLINTMVFILIGLELPQALAGLTSYSIPTLVGYALAISGALIVTRFIWVFRATYLPIFLFPWVRRRETRPPVRDAIVVGWSGMRGVVSLAIALAIPQTTLSGDPFPERELIVFLSYSVILVTLVAQGLTLRPLIRWLKVGADCDIQVEERLARTKTLHAAMAEIDALERAGTVPAPIARTVRDAYAHRLTDVEAMFGDWLSGPVNKDAAQHRATLLAGIGASRRRLLKLRREGQIGDEVLLRVQRELDLDELRLG